MRVNFYKNKKQGLTLIEIMLVIAILAILASITIIAINPSQQLAKSRDSQRSVDIYSIISALYQFAEDHDDSFPDGLGVEELEICRGDALNCAGLYDLSELILNQEYLVSIPVDPLCDRDLGLCAENGTGYFLKLTEGGRVTVTANQAERQPSITVTR